MGFSIEYDFSKLPYGDLRRRLCFPVFYVSKVRDASRYIFRADVRDFNNLFGQFLALQLSFFEMSALGCGLMCPAPE